MKKILAIVLVLVMVMAMAGCNNNGGETTTAAITTPSVVAPNTALGLLESVWANFAEDEKFAVIGGDFGNPVDNAPGSYSLEEAEGLSATLLIPADQLANVTEAATMVHMMNANTFTGGVVRLAEGTVASAFAKAVRDAIQNNQWMCGFPEKMLVATLGDYIIIAYGLNDAMNPFQLHLVEAYADTDLTFNELIGG